MPPRSEHWDAIIIGAGAAGLFCAGEAGARGRRILVLDHAEKLGEKIRISGGGRCNFTNIHTKPENFISENPKFAVSALAGFSPQDFIARVDAAGIGWHEKHLGQLFCDDKAQAIIDLLLDHCRSGGVSVKSGTPVSAISRETGLFRVDSAAGRHFAPHLVIATGGKSIPKIGATGFGYQIADQFGLRVVEPRPALVPLTFDGPLKDMSSSLAGVSVDASVLAEGTAHRQMSRRARVPAFRDGFLFTHRGLSGPSILQASSYWREGEAIAIDLAPGVAVFDQLRGQRQQQGRVHIANALGELLPRRLAQALCELQHWQGTLADWSDARLRALSETVRDWRVTPTGSEGYRTAEVTLGGVETHALHSSTMEAKAVPGLFFIGEVVDVTGWLGGYNFQWAWASAHAAAKAL